jgi:hypothetical protein
MGDISDNEGDGTILQAKYRATALCRDERMLAAHAKKLYAAGRISWSGAGAMPYPVAVS